MSVKDIREVVNSFLTFEELYEKLERNNWRIEKVLIKKSDTVPYPELDWLLDYFEAIEEYEKCHKIKIIKDRL